MVLGIMAESEIRNELMFDRLLEMIAREFGRRNLDVDDNHIWIKDRLSSVGVDVHGDVAMVYAFLHGEGDYLKFPLDGSIHTLEQLATDTNYGPGAYVNVDHSFYVPNYPFLLKDDDLDSGDFVIRVIDRLIEMADRNSWTFNRAMRENGKEPEPEPSLFDSDLELDEDGTEGIIVEDTDS